MSIWTVDQSRAGLALRTALAAITLLAAVENARRLTYRLDAAAYVAAGFFLTA